MKLHRVLPFGVIALAALSMGAGCPTVPKLEDRVVQLAIGGSTTLPEATTGITNNAVNQTGFVDLGSQIDVSSLIDKSGVDLQNVDDIKLSGVWYRVTVPDPVESRTITGTVAAGRGAAPTIPNTPLITSFNQNAGATTDWLQAPLDPAGVTMINGLLTDILTAAKTSGSVPNPLITFTYSGTSSPTGADTQFTWQLRLNLTIIGKVKVKVIN